MRPAIHLRHTQRRPEPEPFDQRADGRGETLHEQQGEPRADARKRLVQSEVAQPETDESAKNKKPETRAAQDLSQTRAPIMRAERWRDTIA